MLIFLLFLVLTGILYLLIANLYGQHNQATSDETQASHDDLSQITEQPVPNTENTTNMTDTINAATPACTYTRSSEPKAIPNIQNTGKSLMTFPDNYTVLDLETTGLEFANNDIIEICALKIINNKITDRYISFVRPTVSYFRPTGIPANITEITGITNEMVANAPSQQEALSKLRDFIGSDICIGHNIVKFDAEWLIWHFDKYLDEPFPNNCVDTWQLSKRLLPDLRRYSLSSLEEYFNIKVAGNAHRAERDCLMVFACLQKLREIACEKYGSVQGFEQSLFQKKSFRDVNSKYETVKAVNIKPSTNEFDPTNIFYKKRFVFTGIMPDLPRENAMQLIVDNGGKVADSISKLTDFLVVGIDEYAHGNPDFKSRKQKQAEKILTEGGRIKIIPYQDFVKMTKELLP